jgi:hemerythrin-like metal-binding protein
MVIQWTDELSVKIPWFDDEHKQLIAMINKLDEAISAGEGNKALGELFVELADYIQNHFKNEEDAMQKLNYPDFASHRKLHDDFVITVNNVKKQHDSGVQALGLFVSAFLCSWVQEHIMEVDRSYSDFFIENGLK